MTLLTDQLRLNRVIFRDQVFTKEYFGRAIDECASYLDSSIRSNSPVVHLVAPNHIKTIVAFLGIIKTGRAALLVDPKTGRLEYEEMLAETTPSATVRIDPKTIEFDHAKEIELTDFHMDQSLIRQLDDVCVMLYTAAEDGYAKAAMLTHHNILSNAQAIALETGIQTGSLSCVILPFNHLYGFQNGVIVPMVAGNSELISDISDIRRINSIARDIVLNQATHIYSVPLIYYLLSKSPYIGSIGRHANMLMSGGYKLPDSLRRRYDEKLNIPILEGYGLTEASPAFICQSKNKQFDKASIGQPMVDYFVKIADDEGNEMPLGQRGEIWFHGNTVMKGYFNRPEATKEKIVDGWLRTGDYGKQDKDGNVFFLGLKKKMFNVAGNKVYPEEVQRLMMKNADVKHVELFSEYNEITGDKVRANITLRDASPAAKDSFAKWCRVNLTPYKVPEKMAFTEIQSPEKQIIGAGFAVACGYS